MSFSVLHEVQAPLGVDAAVWAPLLSHIGATADDPSARTHWLDAFHPSEVLLATARGAIVEIYRLLPYVRSLEDAASSAAAPVLRLLCAARFAEPVASLVALPLVGRAAQALAGVDELHALVVTTAPGRVSVCAIDAASLRLKPVTLVNLEEDALGVGSAVRARRRYAQCSGCAGMGWTAVDPLHRALALLVYDEQLAILPVRARSLDGLIGDDDDDDVDAMDEDVDGARVAATRQALSTTLARSVSDPPSAAVGEADAADAAATRMDALTAEVIATPFILDLADPDACIVPTQASATAAAKPVGAPAAGTVRALCFCSGFTAHPAVAVLSERYTTSASRLASLAHTCVVTVLALSMESRKATVAWRYEQLPHDCFAVLPLPAPYFGVIVLSPNAVLYLNQYQAFALAVNALASATLNAKASFRIDTNISFDASAEKLNVDLSGARATMLTPSQVLIILSDGAVYVLTVCAGATGDAHHFVLRSAGAYLSAPACACALSLPDSIAFQFRLSAQQQRLAEYDRWTLLFTGSRLGDNTLILLQTRSAAQAGGSSASAQPRTIVSIEEEDAAIFGTAEESLAGTKRPRSPSVVAEQPEALIASAPNSGIDDEDAFLYGSAPSRPTAPAVAPAPAAVVHGAPTSAPQPAASPTVNDSAPVSIYIVDTLPNPGRCADMAHTKHTQLPVLDDDTPPACAPLSFMCSANGKDVTGAMCCWTQLLHPIVETTVPISRVTGAWFMDVRCPTAAADAPSPPSAVLLALEGRRGRLFSTMDGLSELAEAETEFPLSGLLTVCAGVVRTAGPTGVAEPRLLYVHTSGARVLNGVPPYSSTQEVPLQVDTDMGGLGAAAGHSVVSASIAEPHALVLLSDGSARLLTCDSDGDVAVSVVPSFGSPITAAHMIFDSASVFASLLGVLPDAGTECALAAFATRDGFLRICTVPDAREVLTVAGAHSGIDTLLPINRGSAATSHLPSRHFIRELTAACAPVWRSATICLRTSTGDVFVYELVAGAGGADVVVSSGTPVSARAPARLVRRTLDDLRVLRCAPAPEDPLERPLPLLQPALVPFRNCSGWSGVVCMATVPTVLLHVRGGVQALPFCVPDGTGSATTVGDGMFLPQPLRAFTPFHSDACPSGLLIAAADSIRFCQLTAPAAPSIADVPHARLLPASCFRLDSPTLPLAPAACALACRELPLTPPEADPSTMLPSISPSAGRMFLASSGPACAMTRQVLFCSPKHVVALSAASAAAGQDYLQEWRRSRGAAAKPGKDAFCLHGLVALCVASQRVRDHFSDMADVNEQLAAVGGEHAQLDYGENIELAPWPAPPTTDPSITRVHEAYAAAGLALPTAWDHDHSVRLYEIPAGSSLTSTAASEWILHDEYRLARYEKVLRAQEIALVDGPGQKGVGTLVIGTVITSPRGEDAASTGRIHMLRVVRTVTPAGLRFSWKRLVSTDTDAPVTALATTVVKDTQYVFVGEGRKLRVCTWINNAKQTALLERYPYRCHNWVRSISCIAEYVVVCDLLSSARFLRWRHEDSTLRELARDVNPWHSNASELFRYESTLGVVVADTQGNLQVLTYAPKETHDRLALRADVRVGQRVTKMIRERIALTPGATAQVLALNLATNEGGLHLLIPIDEITFKRLLTVQQLLHFVVEQPGAVNPRQARVLETDLDADRPPARNVLDASLLRQYLAGPQRLQRAIAKGMGSSVDRIVENLRGIEMAGFIW